MELIGIIGGLSWESTAEYLRLLNEGVRARLGGLHSARLRVATVDFAPVEQMMADGDWSGVASVLVEEARSLEAAGAAFALLATNTLHKVYDEVAAAVSIPVLHLCDVTASAALAAGVGRVGLLGTRYTMEQSFYRDRLASHGVQAVVPSEADRQAVQRIIFDELCVGRVDGASTTSCSTYVGPCWTPARKASCSAARSSNSASDLGISTSRCSRPPRCTARPPSTGPSASPIDALVFASPALAELVGGLSVNSDVFRTMWTTHDVKRKNHDVMRPACHLSENKPPSRVIHSSG
ncbi:hypothetical protein GCM10018954_029020 [Kutzneria kofuensis]